MLKSLGILSQKRNFLIFSEQFLRYIHFIGIRTVYVTSILAMSVGVLAALTAQKILYQSSFTYELYIQFVSFALVKEASIIISGIIMIVRASSFINIKLSLMRYNKEFETLKILDIDSMYYIYLPSFYAFLLSYFGVVIYFNFVAVSFSYLFISNLTNSSFIDFWKDFFTYHSSVSVYIMLIKIFIGGVVISISNILFSYQVQYKLKSISYQTSNSLTFQIVVIFIVNILFSLTEYYYEFNYL